jgi:hypothetical protein
MPKPNLEYLRQYEICRKMADRTKSAGQKEAWLELAAKWLTLAGSARDALKPRQGTVRPTGAPLHLKRFAS